jgi:glycosyltransferase involved in cell wall biosynthesis
MPPHQPKLLFLVTEDWYFVSHRLEFARRLLSAGCEVAVGCHGTGSEEPIRAAGVKFFELPFARGGLSWTGALRECLPVRRLLKSYRPDIVHQVALRPILVGSLASVGLPHVRSVNALAGLGSLFTGELDSAKLRLTQRLVLVLLRWAMRRRAAFNVLQNQEDLDAFIRRGFVRAGQCDLIRGAGIDPAAWIPQPEPTDAPPVVLFVGRLLRDKGVGELVEASRLLKARAFAHALRLIGWPDPWNPTSFTDADLRAWQEGGELEWLGRRDDVLEQMSRANVVALPSYREGLPKVLLEAGLAARAVVTCDVVGCRELVTHDVNGLLVPARAPVALADALQRLLTDPALRTRLAQAHHERVCREFTLDRVTDRFLKLYEQVLSTGKLARGASTAGMAHFAGTP